MIVDRLPYEVDFAFSECSLQEVLFKFEMATVYHSVLLLLRCCCCCAHGAAIVFYLGAGAIHQATRWFQAVILNSLASRGGEKCLKGRRVLVAWGRRGCNRTRSEVARRRIGVDWLHLKLNQLLMRMDRRHWSLLPMRTNLTQEPGSFSQGCTSRPTAPWGFTGSRSSRFHPINAKCFLRFIR